MMKKKKTFFSIISCIVLIIVIVCVAIYSLMSPINDENTHYIYIDSDDNVDSVCAKVDEVLPGVSEAMFDLLTRNSLYKGNVYTGRYAVTPSTTTFELFIAIRGHHTVPVELLLPSVRTVDELADRLTSQLMITSDELKAVFNDEQFISELGFTKETLPAMFIPNTYEIYWDISARHLLEKLKEQYDAFWDGKRASQAEEIGFTPNEITTIASIVESETYIEEEKPIIAGLYINRLHCGMKLQSCPTVIYAIGDFSIQRLLTSQLTIDSPYNTYKYEGLPPGPIRIPSIAAIDAVLNYEHHDYLFMCAKDDFSGRNVFTSSSREHQANARRYQRALNHRGIRQ